MRVGIIDCSILRMELTAILEKLRVVPRGDVSGCGAARLALAVRFCSDFNLTLEQMTVEPALLKEWLLKAKKLTDGEGESLTRG